VDATLYGVGWGWDANVHVQLRPKWMLRYMGWGWDANVHVQLRPKWMLRWLEWNPFMPWASTEKPE